MRKSKFTIYNRKRPHSAIKYMTPAQYEDKNPLLYFKTVA
jgi:transposase InsO family protein